MVNTIYNLNADLQLGLTPRVNLNDTPANVYEDISDLYAALQNVANRVADLEASWNIGATQTITTEAVTTIAASNTFYTAAGTFTISNAQDFDAPSNGQLRYLGESSRDYLITYGIKIDGTSGDALQLRLRKYDDSAATTSTISTQIREVYTLSGSDTFAFFNIMQPLSIDQNDYVFLEVANTSGTNNVTLKAESYLRILQR